MKNWILRFRTHDRKNFEDIRIGVKEFETRAGTEKYQSIEVGDELMFDCGGDRFSKKVVEKFSGPILRPW